MHSTCSTVFIPQNAEPAANTVTDTALPKSTSEGSTLSGNFHTNLMEAADNSQPNLEPSAPDYNTTRQIQSQPGRANGSGSARMDPTPENPEVPLPQASLPCMSNYIVESLEPRNSSRLAIEQGVARAKALLQRAREEKAGREQ